MAEDNKSEVTPDENQQQIRGRSAFNVELTPAGVVINTVFVGEDEQVRPLPAVFPNLEYALNQIDALRGMVVSQFAQAAELGMKSLQAQQAASEEETSESEKH
jgi:hypothetical protein